MQSSGSHCVGEERPDDCWEASGSIPYASGVGGWEEDQGASQGACQEEGGGGRGPQTCPCLGESCKFHQCERPLLMVVALGTG